MALISTFRQLDKCFCAPLNLVNLRSIMLLLLRTHYADSDNFGDFKDALKCLTYSPDEVKEGNLVIELGSVPPDLGKAGSNPAIYVNFDGKVVQEKKVINNAAGSSEDNSVEYFTWLARANIVVSHLYTNIDVALTMAESSQSFFSGIRKKLMQTIELASMEVAGLDFPKPSTKDIERYFRVDLILSIVFNYKVSVNIESHRLKKFALELSAT